MQAGRLEDVPASEGSAGGVDRERSVRSILALDHIPTRLSLLDEADRFEVLQLLVREPVIDLGEVDLGRGAADLREAIGHLRGELGVDGLRPIPRLEGRRIASPANTADPHRVRVPSPRRGFGGKDEDDAAIRGARDVQGAKGCETLLGRQDLSGIHVGGIGGE